MNILLADDDENLRNIIQIWLEHKGHEVETAKNGKEALRHLNQQQFDTLISDVNMPLMNGIDLVKNALEITHPPELIVLLTSRCDIDAIKKEIGNSMVHFCHKPFSPKQLIDLIESLNVKSSTPS